MPLGAVTRAMRCHGCSWARQISQSINESIKQSTVTRLSQSVSPHMWCSTHHLLAVWMEGLANDTKYGIHWTVI